VSKVIDAVRAHRDEIAKDIPKLQEEVMRAEHAFTRAQQLLAEAMEISQGLEAAASVLDDIDKGRVVATRVAEDGSPARVVGPPQ
jgi:hypothetical protein